MKELIKETMALGKEKGYDYTWEEAPKLLMYMVTELAETMEAWRDGNKEEFEAELVDVYIWLLYAIGKFGFEDSFAEAFKKKTDKNWKREKYHGKKLV